MSNYTTGVGWEVGFLERLSMQLDVKIGTLTKVASSVGFKCNCMRLLCRDSLVSLK